jgi:hypothetical protein
MVVSNMCRAPGTATKSLRLTIIELQEGGIRVFGWMWGGGRNRYGRVALLATLFGGSAALVWML